MRKIRSIRTLIRLINNFNALKLNGEKIFTIFLNKNTWESLIGEKVLMIPHLLVHLDDKEPDGIISIGKVSIDELPSATVKVVYNINEVLKRLSERDMALIHPDTYDKLKPKGSVYVLFPAGSKVRTTTKIPQNLVTVVPNVDEGMHYGGAYEYYLNRTRKVAR
jgi:hypothetical protein